MTTRAQEDLLASLHNELARGMLERLQSGEPLTAAEWSAIAKFLKDNDITCEVAQSAPLQDLVGAIPKFDTSPLRIVKEA